MFRFKSVELSLALIFGICASENLRNMCTRIKARHSRKTDTVERKNHIFIYQKCTDICATGVPAMHIFGICALIAKMKTN